MVNGVKDETREALDALLLNLEITQPLNPGILEPLNPLSLTYVLITPARNEAAFIELTIKSVIGQTVLPLKWVIVSDGSTDGTDEIVKKYIGEHPWIELVRMPERVERHFAGKVHAFNAGYARVRGLELRYHRQS